MAIQEFDFSTGKVLNSERRQAIICVEDQAATDVLADVLRQKSYKLLVKTADIKEALARVRKHKVGVLFLDSDIEGVDAIGILKALNSGFPEFNTILVSSEVGKEMISAASEQGVSGFLVSPIDPEMAIKALSRLK